jgi:hypothetical protein
MFEKSYGTIFSDGRERRRLPVLPGPDSDRFLCSPKTNAGRFLQVLTEALRRTVEECAQTPEL